jgi:hypothetical protein
MAIITRAIVSVVDGFADDDSPIERARVTILGESPNATAKLYSWDGGRFVEYDRLSAARVTEGPGGVQIMGMSDRLMNDVGARGEDAIATWFIDPRRGCVSCG